MSRKGYERNSLKAPQIKIDKRMREVLYMHSAMFSSPQTHYRKLKEYYQAEKGERKLGKLED
jgi:hypothetical protein